MPTVVCACISNSCALQMLLFLNVSKLTDSCFLYPRVLLCACFIPVLIWFFRDESITGILITDNLPSV